MIGVVDLGVVVIIGVVDLGVVVIIGVVDLGVVVIIGVVVLGVVVMIGVVDLGVVVIIGVQQNLVPQHPFESVMPLHVSPSLIHVEPLGHVSMNKRMGG